MEQVWVEVAVSVWVANRALLLGVRDTRSRDSVLALSARAAPVSDRSDADSCSLCVGFRQSVQPANNNSQQISESCEELNSTIYKMVPFSVLWQMKGIISAS